MSALERVAGALPGGERLVSGLLGAVRESLAGAIQVGFLFVLVAAVLSVAGALLMENIRLKDKPDAGLVPGGDRADGLGAGASAASSTSLPREPRQPYKDGAPVEDGSEEKEAARARRRGAS